MIQEWAQKEVDEHVRRLHEEIPKLEAELGRMKDEAATVGNCKHKDIEDRGAYILNIDRCVNCGFTWYS